MKIVTIGGGTGNSTILKGLKKITNDITTIVTVADDGGGSGVLRKDLGILPPGDIRACLLALANVEPAMKRLMDYRFQEGILKGQSFGNLFIAAMVDIYGDFDKAIKETGNVLAITGKVLPMTLDDVTLYAEMEDGSIIKGESNIGELTKDYPVSIRRVYLKPDGSKPVQEAVDEILNTDIVLIGPGSLYTSIMPNLLIEDIARALKATKAKIYYICNIMTQNGETSGYSVFDHVSSINRHLGFKIIDKIIVNKEEIPEDVLRKYDSVPVYLNDEDMTKLKEYEIVELNCYKNLKGKVRHDYKEIGRFLLEDFQSEYIGN
ncbi:YvcK family protein [Lagierella sp.]|uniref:gluconeogenesis factor YvcK family protein n=1 Tax=Lagierella sp. TaxID=2849657 RepID=UPI002607B2E8|nr:YvcK family protein [Lagierella sp.]